MKKITQDKKLLYLSMALGYTILLMTLFGGILFGYWYGTTQQEAALFTQLAIRDYHLENYMCTETGRIKIVLPENLTKDMYIKND